MCCKFSIFIQRKLVTWWIALIGSDKSRHMVRVRRGGPWNRELELYYGLIEQRQVTSIHEDKAVEHQANADDRGNRVSKNRLHLS